MHNETRETGTPRLLLLLHVNVNRAMNLYRPQISCFGTTGKSLARVRVIAQKQRTTRESDKRMFAARMLPCAPQRELLPTEPWSW